MCGPPRGRKSGAFSLAPGKPATRLKAGRGDDKTAYDFITTGSKWEKLSKMWWRIFKQNDELNLPHLTFYCTCVTFITRGAKQGVPQSQMMKLVHPPARKFTACTSASLCPTCARN